jgi:hypothetical protein
MPITTTPSGGPQGEFSTYTPLYSQTLSGNTTSVTFSNIPTTYTDLRIVASLRSTRSALWDSLSLRFNSDASSTYSGTNLQSNSSSNMTSGRESNSVLTFTGNFPAASAPSSVFGLITVDILNYSNTTTNKTYLAKGNATLNATNNDLELISLLYRNLSPITSITLLSQTSSSFVSGSTFTLYGIKAAETQFIPVNAAGGDAVVSDGTYAYHVFKSSGVFAPAKTLSCEVLVVAGGGGGGFDFGTGGGVAGGLKYSSSLSVSTATAVTVGAGGAAGTSGNAGGGTNGVNGNNSVFSSTTSTGGGGGGTWWANGSNGGSGGGGGGRRTYPGGTGIPGEGNNGGTASIGDYTGSSGGGGGGAGAVGGTGVAQVTGGVGGAGLNTYSVWASATNTGVSGFYAGGGGGGASYTGTFGAGGAGGGGAGGFANSSNVQTSGPVPGTANTGGGGGGSAMGATQGGTSANGGSGIVIVRYLLNA